ncbi:MAG: S46 family peptidase [Microscillaceae bacterium]|jgi:hypothetical protein|nr:S46 family peptidase [Microscillaceae bacterium]
MLKRFTTLLLACCLALPSFADEGMWLLLLLGKKEADMKKKGFKLTAADIYNVNKASMKDAIISFGGFCTGEIVSKDGLILTNHHCGYDAIQSHSTVENDILSNGWWAKNRGEEKPSAGIFARFLVRMEDVTAKINAGLTAAMTEPERAKKIKELSDQLTAEAIKGTHYTADVRNMFGGNEFYLFVYETFKDVRLVGTPPEAIGKFGGDTDNWMWPRHTGDFSVFRVYMGKDGKPADYSVDNVPLKAKYHLPISLKGLKPNDFTMVMGYPGSTDRFLTSPGVEMAINLTNPAFVKIRDQRLKLWKEDMDVDKKVRLQYASKYANIANYWKYFIGQTEICKRLKIYDLKKSEETALTQWLEKNPAEKAKYGEALPMIEDAYKTLRKYTVARTFITQALYAPEIVIMSASLGGLQKALKGGNQEEVNKQVAELKSELAEMYKDYNASTDKKILAALYKMTYEDVEKAMRPDFFAEIETKYGGDFNKFAEAVFSQSIFVSKEKLEAFLNAPKAETLENDLALKTFQSIQAFGMKLNQELGETNQKLDKGNRLFIAGIRAMNPNKVYYPNANSTMRLTYGQVLDYFPKDGVKYLHITTLDGIMEKEDPNNPEFIVPTKLKELYQKKDFGRYAENGTVPVAFISNNDITGGNSGSPVINGEGQLVGIAFDGNWEAMSDKIAFEPRLQRCINVDIRYVLFCIEKLGGAKHLVDEMTIIPAKTQ